MREKLCLFIFIGVDKTFLSLSSYSYAYEIAPIMILGVELFFQLEKKQ